MASDSQVLRGGEAAVQQIFRDGVEVIEHLLLMGSDSGQVPGSTPLTTTTDGRHGEGSTTRVPGLQARAEAIAEILWVVANAETAVAFQNRRRRPGGLGLPVHQALLVHQIII